MKEKEKDECVFDLLYKKKFKLFIAFRSLLFKERIISCIERLARRAKPDKNNNATLGVLKKRKIGKKRDISTS